MSNRAALPRPSALPGFPALPANVVTTQLVPIARNIRIVLLPSTTNTFPALSTATPVGRLNCAALFVPSALPGFPTLPANVVTTPTALT